MTCAMDWTYVGPDPTFYDVWIARTITGNTFSKIGSDGNWNSAWNLFWDDSTARERYQNHKPFQVFSCWNSATAFTAKPLLKQKIAFRSANNEECFQGEPRLWCKDMWHLGYGKIAVIPTVNVEYSDEATRKIKDLKGYVSHWVPQDSTIDTADWIKWKADPPAEVKCITDPDYSAQHFVPWDQVVNDFFSLGTPHHIRTLQINSTELELIHELFMDVYEQHDQQFKVLTFQEAKGVVGISYLKMNDHTQLTLLTIAGCRGLFVFDHRH
ncbi:Alpha-1,3-mannosyltransferase [Lachnellula hyalina]|uniref:Alpha-1,3-mannosyltransferase n=1 Tax=Lachnellula hyalina TaxID=1316788 RepID=A0A8H8QYJ1_9HELO|nr:Alpha-1,3-mannosyltransferase [Lachnellula hyalina]TVY25213.1 Alpha-1,3-mannosyltransferase [Lachnellula hyalina]